MMVIGFAFASMAQSQMTKENVYKLRAQDAQEVNMPQNQLPPVLNTKATNEDVSRIVIGMAANQRMLRREEIKAIAYNPELDLISVNLVLDPETYDEADVAGIVAQIYSTDHGQTWSSPVVVNDDVDDGPNYYISGTIFNPDGNTEIDNAFGVYQGTINPTSGSWNYKAFGSNNFGGEYLTTELIEDPDNVENGYWNQFGLTQAANEVRCMAMVPEGAWGAYTAISLELIIGEFNGTDFDWNLESPVDVDLIEDDVNGGAFWQGRWQGYDASTEMAWSSDGNIGYMWIIGISEEEFSGIQPQVYYTEDGGDSWDYVFVDFQTDEIQEMVDPFLLTNWAGYMTPAFFESAGVVNANGELELFGAMGSHSADIFNYPDSINWQFTYPGDIANLTINADGLQSVMWVDSLLTDNVLAETSGNYAGSTGWQHRLHASRTADGSQVFITWTETLVSEEGFNTNPDLFGWSKGICDDSPTEGPINFTEGTIYETFYFFNSSADLVFENADGNYSIPTLQGADPTEAGTNALMDPITLSYITGIEFSVLCPVGLDEMTQANGIQVSQNMPNPFTGSTTINVSTQTAADVTVEVSNIIGQSIYTINAGIINGTQEIILPAENLEAGIYFYTVRIGNESISKKMIIE